MKEAKGKFIFDDEEYDIKMLEDKSCYGKYYYEILEASKQSNEIDFRKNNILYEEHNREYSDDCGTYEYWIGYFEGNKFVSTFHLDKGEEKVWL